MLGKGQNILASSFLKITFLSQLKHTKTGIVCYPVEFSSGIRLGSAFVCHNRTTSELL